ncbi:NAD kinase [Ammoniphilus sp. CFH 90114]|uniref:NAD kinase n=1 Tax=Ammoniphilus sp. CFH 90114 TaxID=2493665 RepID=UPI00100E2701|nr:NAD kinase [Ammoniphilus sp. CFH 90114]RXT15218.1 NAD kinase [Ammoniphilus sp. CFH 90114]
MEFAVISRGDEVSEAKKEIVTQYLNGQGFNYNQVFPRVVIAIGGDGTVLQAFHTYKHRLESTAFIAYNTGHLGFYSDWDNVESLLEAIVDSSLITVEYPLVQAEVEADGQTVTYQALNDVTIKGVKGSVQIDVRLNNHHFESFKGDGLCISSPSGSTGYNKSLGGAIVHPSLEIIQLSEMASINNRVYRTIGSSLVIPKHHILTLLPKADTYMLSVDHESFPVESIQQLTCSVAKEKIRFLRCRSFPFWNRVKEAFISLNDCEPRGGR